MNYPKPLFVLFVLSTGYISPKCISVSTGGCSNATKDAVKYHVATKYQFFNTDRFARFHFGAIISKRHNADTISTCCEKIGFFTFRSCIFYTKMIFECYKDEYFSGYIDQIHNAEDSFDLFLNITTCRVNALKVQTVTTATENALSIKRKRYLEKETIEVNDETPHFSLDSAKPVSTVYTKLPQTGEISQHRKIKKMKTELDGGDIPEF